MNLRDVVASDAEPRPQVGGALHSAFSGLPLVGADRPFAGVGFNKMRRPGAQRSFKRWGPKTLLDFCTRPGSRRSPHPWVRLMINPFLV